ncbi:TPA: 30S ribosomal protein S8 [Candidatus Dependentiae bacterium]|nr:MAG: 30S ribosomal protein S8 [candidate division TM6 bacterium GW2011_GWF2_36_131]KKQ03072.1 MAG: 30S ribosomal protein S8 [candidate division TM6 bacterium GW2011_GWE2_36_25]KKQ18431.1 MAG: 30S ribosomal protein S8 [candidate division TM6 bacterium GW2011_GWA2_36_9]HBR71154.1 30S ribosomal protein S8 [Candidatus Dependentiae bacterium]HCU00469.1 30S ribosomal protein S8 [Candidatus Dependentiae bacterium]
MSQDSIGDFLTIIRNGIMASKAYVLVPFSKLKLDIATLLKNEGFITDVLVEEKESNKKELKVLLKYVDGESVIHELKRVSTPGRRQYKSSFELKPVIGGLGILILTTSHGIMTDKRAKKQAIGGEVICAVW